MTSSEEDVFDFDDYEIPDWLVGEKKKRKRKRKRRHRKDFVCPHCGIIYPACNGSEYFVAVKYDACLECRSSC